MTPELTYLLYATVLLIVHMLVQATMSDLSKGIIWAIGARDEPREQNAVAARLERALNNYVHNFPAFIALACILAITESGTESTALGAAIWFWSRIAYIAAYVSGIPVLRPVTWFVSLVGLALMALPLFSL